MRRNAYGNKVDLSGHVAFLCAWCRWRSQCVISSGKTQRFHGKKTCLIWIHGPVTHNLVKIGCWNLLKATALGGLERIFSSCSRPVTNMQLVLLRCMLAWYQLWPLTFGLSHVPGSKISLGPGIGLYIFYSDVSHCFAGVWLFQESSAWQYCII